ncbi:hypothetical protein [Eikenella corrodens]|uniref:hypothetical protein n=1 Tax=Eikenella corrodens TaxID=539 RepID=UPI00129B4435|nr:hypothetical protein [Eikenella corrodens]
MSKFIGLFGHVADVKAVKSLGVCRLVVEVPIEQHKAVTNGFWDADVLVTLSDAKQAYGVAEADKPEQEELADYGHYYQALYKSGFFHNPALWRWAGTDGEYQDYVRALPSCVSGRQDYDADSGRMRCEYAHVRRVSAGAGTGVKPEYSGVPLTHEEHALQHCAGESALLGGAYKDGRLDWFQKKAAEYRTAWIKSVLYAHFGVESLKEVPPQQFAQWAQECGMYPALPAVFKGECDGALA